MDLLNRIAADVPNMVALIITVGLFLRYITKRDEANKEMIEEINRENAEARRHSREIIERNTAAFSCNTAAMTELAHAFEELRVKCRRDE